MGCLSAHVGEPGQLLLTKLLRFLCLPLFWGISQLPLVGKGWATFEVFPQVSIVWPGGWEGVFAPKMSRLCSLARQPFAITQTTQLRGQ